MGILLTVWHKFGFDRLHAAFFLTIQSFTLACLCHLCLINVAVSQDMLLLFACSLICITAKK